MFTRMCAALQKSCFGFKRNAEGSVVSTFALSLVPVVGLVGAAVDYSAASNARMSLQVSLDAALLAGAKDGTTSWADTALNTFNANLNPKTATNAHPTFPLTTARAHTGPVTATVPSNFLGVLGVSGIDISASGTAVVPPADNG